MMNPKDDCGKGMGEALRDVFLEASTSELRSVFSDDVQAYKTLAARGRAIATRALQESNEEKTNQVVDLHRGLGTLVGMLRRRDGISLAELAEKARVDADEIKAIENDPQFDPNPRTVVQLANHFKLPPKSMIVLSGAFRVEKDMQMEVQRFAASSKSMNTLSREERKLLNRFVKFLCEHTDG